MHAFYVAFEEERRSTKPFSLLHPLWKAIQSGFAHSSLKTAHYSYKHPFGIASSVTSSQLPLVHTWYSTQPSTCTCTGTHLPVGFNSGDRHVPIIKGENVWDGSSCSSSFSLSLSVKMIGSQSFGWSQRETKGPRGRVGSVSKGSFLPDSCQEILSEEWNVWDVGGWFSCFSFFSETDFGKCMMKNEEEEGRGWHDGEMQDFIGHVCLFSGCVTRLLTWV